MESSARIRWSRCAGAHALAALLVALPAASAADEGTGALEAVDPGRVALERIEQWRRDDERRAPMMGTAATPRWRVPLADERPCFVVQRVLIDATQDAASPAFSSRAHRQLVALTGLVREIPGFEGACLGVAGINALRLNLQDRLHSRGFITSTLAVPTQDLRSGDLRFELEPGRVEAVLVEAGDPVSRPARNALALAAGDLLDLRALEQTLENLARLPGQSARFVVEPGSARGTSVVRILPLAAAAGVSGLRWRASVGLERPESGPADSWQWSTQLALDHALKLSDQFSLWAAHGPGSEGPGRAAHNSVYLSWSVPLGWSLLTLSHGHARHRRDIAAGVGLLRETGHDDTARLRWQWTVWRGPAARLNLWAAASQRRARTWLEDIELISRRRLADSTEQGAELWWRGSPCDAALALDGAQVQRVARDQEFQPLPLGLPRSWRAEVQASCRLGGGLDYQAQAWVQRIARPLDGTDLATLGGRHTVRAHAAADVRTGQGVAVLRQELQAPPWFVAPGLVLRPALALDWGRIHAPLDASAAPRELAAAALALRWRLHRASGEMAVQQPLGAPPPTNLAARQARREARWHASVRVSL